ncbi:MAG: glycoside hydrolase family 99-like domain-containing protein [Planctomycetota bacterium]
MVRTGFYFGCYYQNYFSTYLTQNKIDFKFCLVYQTPYILPFENGVIVIDRESLRLLQNHFLYAANEYFKDPNYLKIDNRPVLFLMVSHLLRGEYELAITKTNNIVQQRTGYNIFLVGDEIILPERDEKQIQLDKKRITLFDAITTCNIWGSPKYDGLPVVTGFFNDINTIFDKYYKITRGMDIKFIPGVMPGFNNHGFHAGTKYPILPREATIDKENEGTTYHVFLQIAKKYLDPNLNMLMINSFNGWSDDTQIEPVASNYLTPATVPIELTNGYKYYDYKDIYLRITKKELSK